MSLAVMTGTGVRSTMAFSTFDGAPEDPDTITARHMTPDGTEHSYVYGTDTEVVKDGDGEYHLDVVGDDVGRHWIRWEGTGALQAAAEDYFDVRQSEF